MKIDKEFVVVVLLILGVLFLGYYGLRLSHIETCYKIISEQAVDKCIGSF